MSRSSPVCQFAPPAAAVAQAWRCAVFAALLLGPGCDTEKQERFQQFNDEGVHLFQHGDYVGAREHFEVALGMDAKNANVLYNLGQCNDRMNQVAKAEACYKQCLELSANHAECRHALAVLLYRTGHSRDADKLIGDWLIAEPERSDAYAEDGWRLRRSGEFVQAVGRFQQALHYDPRNVRAMVELGQLYEEHQQPEFALAVYQRALAVDPKQAELVVHVNDLRAKGIKAPLPE
jgi:Flp pilus assembly protein TadD